MQKTSNPTLKKMIRFLHFVFLFLFLFVLFSGSFCFADSTPADLESLFHQNEMWTGSDGAYSVGIGNGKAIWLFSDTFIGLISGGRRQNNAMINNSIGVQDISSGKMSFYWKQQKKPASYFPKGKGGYWLWLGDGVFYKNKVYCFAKRISSIPGQENEPFGFKWHHDEMIVIDNPTDDPPKWRCHHLVLPFATEKLHFGTACLVDGDMLYVMGLDEPKKETLLSRIPLADLQELNLKTFEFLKSDASGKSEWTNNASESTLLFDQAAAEASLTKCGDKYVCIFHSGGVGARIVARTAQNLVGPWSAEKLLYTIPDENMKRGMCYASKGHPEQPCHDGSMIVTYLINPGKLEQHDKDPYAYFPRVVEVKLP
jgi:hypothetical protein